MFGGVYCHYSFYTLEDLHLCAFLTSYERSKEMRMEPLLFADENAPKWAFSKKKGVNWDDF